MSAINKTSEARLHTAGEGKLPALITETLVELETENGVLTQNYLLTAFLRGLHVQRDDERGCFLAELRLPTRPGKMKELKAKAASFVREGRRYNAETKKWEWPKGNTYHIVAASKEGGCTLTVRILERFSATVGGVEKKFTESTSANFLQAVLKAYADFPLLNAAPEILWKPVTKQACEQILSHVRLKTGIEQEAGAPSTAPRHPNEKCGQWLQAVSALAANTEGFSYEREAKERDGKRGRLKNISPDWIAFASSPYPGRLPVKIEPEHFALYRRHWAGDGRDPNRIYLALRVFAGVGEETPLGHLRTAGEQKLFWWHRYLAEFVPLPPWKEKPLQADFDTIMVPLDCDDKGRFASGFEGGRKPCLLTLSERRVWNRHRQARSYSGHRHRSTERLAIPERVFLAHFSTSAQVDSVLPKRILGIHFSDKPVLAWALVTAEGMFLRMGRIEGNAPLEAGLLAKARLEERQGKLRWVGGWEFRGVIRERTLVLARQIVALALKHGAGLAVEQIEWVNKSSGSSLENRRFSMWNYGTLSVRIEWLGQDIATRELQGAWRPFQGRTAPVIDRPFDYWSAFTCPSCGACRKAKQEREVADTFLTPVAGGKKLLTCRKCGYEGVVSPEEKARIVALRGAARLRQLLEKTSE